MKEFSNKN